MIEAMLKLTIIAKTAERDQFLSRLGELGVLHITPFDFRASQETRDLTQSIEKYKRALEILEPFYVEDEGIGSGIENAVDDIIDTQTKISEVENQIDTLENQYQQQAFWGKLSLIDFQELLDKDIQFRFFKVPSKRLESIKGKIVYKCGEIENGIHLVVASELTAVLPKDVQEIYPPERKNQDILDEIASLRPDLKALRQHLMQLAGVKKALKAEYDSVKGRLSLHHIIDGTYNSDELFAVRGWIPAKKREGICNELSEDACCFYFEEPKEDEVPPTLISYPRWVQPIAGLFDILNVLPGYREPDVSAFFMLFLPIFVAILIGDAGYGLVLLALGIVGYKKIAINAGKDKANLICIFAGVTLLYGILFGSWFGFSPDELSKVFPTLGKCLSLPAVFAGSANEFQIKLTKVSFCIACLHLASAHLIQFLRYIPAQRAWAEMGWAVFITGLFGVIWGLFIEDPFFLDTNIVFSLLVIGVVLTSCFSCPQASWFKARIPLGIASCLLSWISAFSDMVSYIRLMAVGLSGYYIASTVNELAKSFIGDEVTKFSAIAFVIIFVIGHAFNIVLALIAVLAHGVRLNMLEFSNNAGVQWSGEGYSPFVLLRSKGE